MLNYASNSQKQIHFIGEAGRNSKIKAFSW